MIQVANSQSLVTPQTLNLSEFNKVAESKDQNFASVLNQADEMVLPRPSMRKPASRNSREDSPEFMMQAQALPVVMSPLGTQETQPTSLGMPQLTGVSQKMSPVLPKEGSQGVSQERMSQAVMPQAEMSQMAMPRAVALSNKASSVLPQRLQKATMAKSELKQEPTASLNTSGAFAGLKPWSKEWVFDKGPLSQEQRTLVDSFRSAPNPVPQAMNQEQVLDGIMRSNAQMANGPIPDAIAVGDRSPVQDPVHVDFPKESVSGLSGSEFVNTLNSTRGPRPMAVAQGTSPGTGHGTGGEETSRGTIQGSLQGGSTGGFKPRIVSRTHPGDQMLMTAGSAPVAESLGSLVASPPQKETMVQPRPVDLQGHVIPGAMAKERLATASLQNISSQVRSFSLSGIGRGEIRVRLKPENLGELHLRVVTHGSNVGLQIQASDGNAKRVLEESLGYLKDSLATQHLNLSRVELTVNPNTTTLSDLSYPSGNSSQQSLTHDQGQMSNFMGQDARRGNSQDRNLWSGESQNTKTTSGLRSLRPQVTGRLDVMA